MYRSHVLVCGGTGCTSSGSQAIIDKFEAEIEKNGLKDEVAVVRRTYRTYLSRRFFLLNG